MRTSTRKPTHPGEILQELYLKPLGLGIGDFSAGIGISRKTVSGIVNGHRRVTPEMALRFSMALPTTTADMWLNLQNAYDLYMARSRMTNLAVRSLMPATI